MPFDLPAMARRQGRRRNITLRPIVPTQAQANDLARITAPAWKVWADAIPSIMAAYDPKPLGDGLTTDSPDAVQRILGAISAEFLTRLVTEITPSLRRWTVSVERWHRSKWVAAVKAGTDIDLSTILLAQPVEETLQAFLARNVALIRNVSDQAQARIADAVYRGYQNRTPTREVAKELREAVDMGRQRSIRIASDQSSKLSAALDMERQAEAGLDKFKYRHSGKLHGRPHHKARNGKIYFLRSSKQVDGPDQIASGDGPSEPPWCGCRRQGYLDIMGEI